MSRLEETESFLAVVAQGGVSAAARHLGRSKSAVSKQLQALEERLGARLLHRTTRAVSLTDEGRRFHEGASAALEELRAAETAVGGADGPLVGNIRMALPMSFGVRYLAPVIAAFMAEHPRVQVEASFSDQRVDLVEEGFDLAVRGGTMPVSALVARRLVRIALVVVASPAFVATHGAPSEPAELDGLPALVYRQPGLAAGVTLRHQDGRQAEVRLSGRLVSDSGDMLLEAARQGLGLLVQPDFLVAGDLRSGALVRLLPDWCGPDVAMWVVIPHRRLVPARVRAFADFLVARFAHAPWEG